VGQKADPALVIGVPNTVDDAIDESDVS